jgi:methionyl-tRNA formyltransferase
MGTPAFAVPALEAVAACCEVTLVVTQPDRPRGRGRRMAESEVAEAAARLALPVIKPVDMKAAEVGERLAAEHADLFAVVAFGAILTRAVLALPRLGCVNLHGSLLPDYRGASPVQRALWDGRTETGVTTIVMDDGIDTGDILGMESVAVDPDDDAGTLAARLAAVGGPLLAASLLSLHAGTATWTPQDRAAGSYARKLRKTDGIVDWSLPARTVRDHARAVTPWPGATAMLDHRRVLLLRTRVATGSGAPGEVLSISPEGVTVACGDGALELRELKPEGRAAMAAVEWARGARLSPGMCFTRWEESVP